MRCCLFVCFSQGWSERGRERVGWRRRRHAAMTRNCLMEGWPWELDKNITCSGHARSAEKLKSSRRILQPMTDVNWWILPYSLSRITQRCMFCIVSQRCPVELSSGCTQCNTCLAEHLNWVPSFPSITFLFLQQCFLSTPSKEITCIQNLVSLPVSMGLWTQSLSLYN